MIKQYKLRFYNFKLVILLTAISLFGVQLVASASPDLRNKQLLGVVMGLVLLVILSLMDYSWILNFQWIMYGANIALLLIVRLFGDSANGAARWIDFGFIRFQPTELSKIIIILFFARFFMDHEEDLNTPKTLAKSVLLLAVPLLLIYEQPDLKNTLMMLAVFCILIYIAGLSYKIIGGTFLILIPLIIIFLSIVVQPDQKLIKELVDALQEKPAKDGNQALLSNGISIKTYTLENGLLTLNLSGEYGELARPQEVLVRAGLVRTFVQVPEVERVTLLIDGDPLKDSKGREIGTMTADSFLENSGREIYQYQYATLTLYFANEAGDRLVKETRRVPYSTNIPLERVVVEQLMKGPKEDGHYAVFPETMNVLSVTTSDRIAYVNFDKSFKDSALLSVAEQIPIYAVVDSITANCKVDKVQFSINGESDVTFRETMKLNQFYEEDLSYLEEKDT